MRHRPAKVTKDRLDILRKAFRSRILQEEKQRIERAEARSASRAQSAASNTANVAAVSNVSSIAAHAATDENNKAFSPRRASKKRPSDAELEELRLLQDPQRDGEDRVLPNQADVVVDTALHQLEPSKANDAKRDGDDIAEDDDVETDAGELGGTYLIIDRDQCDN